MHAHDVARMSHGVLALLTHIRAEGLAEPVLEHRFSARRWRFDLAWPREMLAVEVDGGVYTQGRHLRGQGFERDCEKLNEATLLGWRVLRATTGQVLSGATIGWIVRALVRSEE